MLWVFLLLLYLTTDCSVSLVTWNYVARDAVYGTFHGRLRVGHSAQGEAKSLALDLHGLIPRLHPENSFEVGRAWGFRTSGVLL